MGKSSGRSGKLHTTPSVGSSVGGANKSSKVDRNGKQKRSDWYCLWRAIAITVGLVIVIAVASYYLIATVRTTVERVHQITSHVSTTYQPTIQKDDAYEHPHPPTSSEEEAVHVATASQGIPTYEEYVRMATAENWHPTDPVQKLESTIKNFARVSLTMML